MAEPTKTRVPTTAEITQRIRNGMAREVQGHLDNGSEFFFDLVSFDDLSPKQRGVYQARVEAAAERVRRLLLGKV